MKRWLAILAVGVLCVAGLGLYMFWAGGQVIIRQETAPLPGLRQPLRVAHLSDLHYQGSSGVTLGYLKRVVALTVAQRPDLILLTGDYIFEQCAYPKEYAEVLAPLARAAPTYASLGNHDGGRWAAANGGYADFAPITNLLAAAGITPLVNRSAVARRGENSVTVIGIGDLWSANFQPGPAFADAPASPRIVLSHSPDSYPPLRRFGWDLMLSGHTHGGQIVLPWLGSPWAPVRDKRYLGGLYAVEGRWLNVSRGLGGRWRLRLNCPPEIVLLTLTPPAAAGGN
jgi:uncharacterized protein